MRKFSIALIICIGLVCQLGAQSIGASFFDEADSFFQTHVKAGKVDYSAAAGSSQLESLVKQVAKADLSKSSDAERKAFYINAYNLLVISKVTKALPIKSVMDVADFFDNKDLAVAGQTVSLNYLEKQLLFKAYPDSRLHFVLVCGAVGCPPIIAEAYRPETLDRQLLTQTKAAINDPTFISGSGSSAELSQIFNWYSSDFGGSTSAVIAYINKYRDSNLSPKAKVSYSEYDWSLNSL